MTMVRLNFIVEGQSEEAFVKHLLSPHLLAAIPGYDNVSAATQVAQAIGLERMRRQCPHFDSWVTLLEGLPGKEPPPSGRAPSAD